MVEELEKANGEDLLDLTDLLSQLFIEAGRGADALRLLDDFMQRYPDDALAAMSKASLCFYILDDPEEALNAIDEALQRAHRTGRFRRLALGQKARILVELYRGDELSDVLEEIMSLQIVRGSPDIARERDFVDRAPPGLIRKSVLDRYNEFRPKRPDDTSTGEPPRWEPPDDGA